MDKYYLKKLRDNMPESLKYLTGPLIRGRLIENEEFEEMYSLLIKRESFSREMIEEYQFSHLKNILIHAKQNVPYYEVLFDKISFDPEKFSKFSDIEKIPILTKDIIRKNFDRLISRKIVRKGSYMAVTGGSTGQPLKVLLDFESVFKENAFIYYFRRSVDYRFEDKLATFRGIEFEDNLWKYNPMQNELTFSPFKLSKVTIKKYVDKINEYKPRFLNGYLSAIYTFAKFLEESGLKLKIKLKGIFLISENIDNNQRSFVEKFFNVESLTFYGHSERCIIAQERKHNHYVFDPFYGYTEFVKSENGLISIVGTGFLNYTMPLIRYITDDTCEPEGDYYLIKGKRIGTMGIYGKNNEFFGQSAFNFHNDMFRNVTNYQFVQRKRGECDFLIMVNKDFDVAEIDIMLKEIDKKSKGIIDFNIKVVENLILTPAGKFNMIVSYLPKEIKKIV